MEEHEKNSKAQPPKELFPCIANRAQKSKFEQFKFNSEYLSQPLSNELRNDIDHFSNDALQLLKFHGSYQQDNRENRKKGESRDWQMMLRLRSPGGKISPSLFSALNYLSDKFGNGTLRATTRQAFQMHGVRKENLREVIKTIIHSMGSTLAACGDVSRNVMAPAAPYETGGYPAARELANEIADLLTPSAAEDSYLDLWVDGDLTYKIRPKKIVNHFRSKQLADGVFSGDKKEPLYGKTYLPRKFKCAVTVPGDNSVDLLTQDIGLVAFTDKGGVLKGCNVYIGGGMGRTHNNEETFARLADPLGYVSKEQILPLVQSILALQRDYGDRKIRRHARMKYLLQSQGIDWFKKELLSNYFKCSIRPVLPEPPRKLEDYLGWHKQAGKKWFVGIPLLSGRISGDFKKQLHQIVTTYQLDIRITPNQDLLLCNIGEYQKPTIRQALDDLGLLHPERPSPINRHAMACPAMPLCGLAITEAERILPNVLNRIRVLLEKLGIKKSILIRMTGCPNGCARPYMAELALVGSGVNDYQLWLGGSPSLERLAKPYIQKLPIDQLESKIEPLLLSWKKLHPKNSFGDHIKKIGDHEVYSLLDK